MVTPGTSCGTAMWKGGLILVAGMRHGIDRDREGVKMRVH